MKKLCFLLFFITTVTAVIAQSACNCNPAIKHWSTCFDHNPEISIGICCRSEISLGAQGFSAAVLNKTGDELEITFDFIVQLNCGKTVTEHVHLYSVKTFEKVSGERFSGDLDLAHDYFTDDCKAKPIIKQFGISIANLKINNISKQQKAKEDSKKKEEEAMQLKAQQEEETRQKEAAVKAKEQEVKEKKEAEQKAKDDAVKNETAKENTAALRRRQYEDSVRLAEENRRARIERAEQKDKEEKLQSEALTTGVTGVMLNDNLNNSKIEGRTTYFKAETYIGGFNIPMVENSSDGNNLKYSSLSSQFTYGAGAALDMWLYNNQKIGFLIQPVVNYGLDMGSGASGTFLSYGANARIQFGKGVKIFGEGGYFFRSGTYENDLDASTASFGIYTNSNLTSSGSFEYTSFRYGGGLLFDAVKEENKEKDAGLKLAVYIDNPQTKNWDNTTKTPLLFELQWIGKGGFFIRGEYSDDYTFAGTTTYKLDDHPKGSYWAVHIGKVFNLTK